MPKSHLRGWELVGLTTFFITIDRASKHLISRMPAPNEEGLLAFASSANHGAAFSIPITTGIIAALSLLLITIAFTLMALSRSRTAQIALSAIAAGGISNVIERLQFSHVTDIIQIGSLNLNIADIFILSGALTLLITTLHERAGMSHQPVVYGR